MSGCVADKKRLVTVTAGNIRNHHLYISGHHDFFPADCIAPVDSINEQGLPIKIHLSGLNQIVETDIGRERQSRKPRRFFRRRSWAKEFFAHHEIKTGDVLAFEKLSSREFRLYPFQTKRERDDDWRWIIDLPPATSKPSVIELFAGCGGMALGFKRAGFETVLANEWDASGAESIRRNVTDRVANCAIQEIDRFPKADVIVGGPPCQGFSNLGERIPNDPRNQLWRHFIRAVQDVNPIVFVMENVPPLLKSQEYAEIERLACGMGYDIVAGVLNAADFGVPQTRRRAFIIGVLNGFASLPTATHAPPDKLGPLHSLPRWRTVYDAISDLSFVPDEINWHIGRNPTALSKLRYSCIPSGGNRWDLPLEIMPECWKRKTKGGTDLFGRLWWDRPSVTIRTEFYKPEKGRYLHPEADRPITHREAARLQGFPDSFDFAGSKISVGIQIGNAVPPPLGEVIAHHVLKLLQDRQPARQGRMQILKAN